MIDDLRFINSFSAWREDCSGTINKMLEGEDFSRFIILSRQNFDLPVDGAPIIYFRSIVITFFTHKYFRILISYIKISRRNKDGEYENNCIANEANN